jgi:hypothetical protein
MLSVWATLADPLLAGVPVRYDNEAVVKAGPDPAILNLSEIQLYKCLAAEESAVSPICASYPAFPLVPSLALDEFLTALLRAIVSTV